MPYFYSQFKMFFMAFLIALCGFSSMAGAQDGEMPGEMFPLIDLLSIVYESLRPLSTDGKRLNILYYMYDYQDGGLSIKEMTRRSRSYLFAQHSVLGEFDSSGIDEGKYKGREVELFQKLSGAIEKLGMELRIFSIDEYDKVVGKVEGRPSYGKKSTVPKISGFTEAKYLSPFWGIEPNGKNKTVQGKSTNIGAEIIIEFYPKAQANSEGPVVIEGVVINDYSGGMDVLDPKANIHKVNFYDNDIFSIQLKEGKVSLISQGRNFDSEEFRKSASNEAGDIVLVQLENKRSEVKDILLAGRINYLEVVEGHFVFVITSLDGKKRHILDPLALIESELKLSYQIFQESAEAIALFKKLKTGEETRILKNGEDYYEKALLRANKTGEWIIGGLTIEDRKKYIRKDLFKVMLNFLESVRLAGKNFDSFASSAKAVQQFLIHAGDAMTDAEKYEIANDTTGLTKTEQIRIINKMVENADAGKPENLYKVMESIRLETRNQKFRGIKPGGRRGGFRGRR